MTAFKHQSFNRPPHLPEWHQLQRAEGHGHRACIQAATSIKQKHSALQFILESILSISVIVKIIFYEEDILSNTATKSIPKGQIEK